MTFPLPVPLEITITSIRLLLLVSTLWVLYDPYLELPSDSRGTEVTPSSVERQPLLPSALPGLEEEEATIGGTYGTSTLR